MSKIIAMTAALLLVASVAIGQGLMPVPKMKTQQLRWLSGPNTSAGMYQNPTYTDTTTLYRSTDTTTAGYVDTTEAFSVASVAWGNLGLGQGSDESMGSLAFEAVKYRRASAAETVQVYVDAGLTRNGPWRSSTNPHFFVKAGSQRVIWGKLLQSSTSAQTSSNNTMAVAMPWVRFRVVAAQATDAGYTGLKCYLMYQSIDQ